MGVRQCCVRTTAPKIFDTPPPFKTKGKRKEDDVVGVICGKDKREKRMRPNHATSPPPPPKWEKS